MNRFFLFFSLFIGILQARTPTDSLLAIWKNPSQKDTSRIKALIKALSNTNFLLQDTSAEQYIKEGLQFIRNKGLQKFQTDLIRIQGDWYYYHEKYDKALQTYEQAMELAREFKDTLARVNIYYGLAQTYQRRGEYEKVPEYYQKGLELARASNNTLLLMKLYSVISLFYKEQGLLELSEEYGLKSLEMAQKSRNAEQLIYNHTVLGTNYSDQGKYVEAMNHLLEALRIAEKNNARRSIARLYINIGNVYVEQKDFDKALEYYNKGLEIAKKLKDTYSIRLLYINLGHIYFRKKQMDKAAEFYTHALELAKKMNAKQGMAYSYISLGNFYQRQGNVKKAEQYFRKAMRISRKIGSKRYIALSYLHLSALAFDKKKNYPQAIQYGEKALKIAKEIKDVSLQKHLYAMLTAMYKESGKYKRALELQEAYSNIKDSIYNKKTEKQLLRKELQYRHEKEKFLQEAEYKARMERQKLLAREEEKRKNYIIAGISSIFVISLIFLGILFNRYRVIRMQRNIIRTQNAELRQQQEELRVINEDLKQKNEEIYSQAEELRTLNERLDEKNKELSEKNRNITDSIFYARRIQEALLKHSDLQRAPFVEKQTLLFQPKDIVSGDFYWCFYKQESGELYLAVADCTGHGVPGSLISILGMEFLSELVYYTNLSSTHNLLDALREKIVRRMNPELETSHSVKNALKDGMDISLIKIKTDTLEAEWSGANNPLYVKLLKQRH